MKVYIAGPMTGYEDFNYPAFHAAAAELRAQGYEVLNPAEHFEGRQDLPYQTYMRGAITALLEAEAIYTLPGWTSSKGAKMEMLIAERLGLPHLNPRGVDELCYLDVWRFTKAAPVREVVVEDGRTQEIN